MELIIGYVHQGLQFIIPLVILLGLLIFVHEMGHFLVAKYFGVRVEVFSLGFGKKLFKTRRGDTEYAISAIPFGGYVKMFGDELGTEIPDEEKGFAFNHKPVGQRIWIVLAGPLMNFFFAILLFMIIALVGEDLVGTTVGDLSPNSAAYSAGFRPGDKIRSVNGVAVQTWEELTGLIQSNKNSIISFDVQSASGETKKVETTTIASENKNVLSDDLLVGEVPGLNFTFRATAVGVSDPNSAAGKAGIKTGYLIKGVNGRPVEKWIDLLRTIESEQANKAATLSVDFVAKDDDKSVTTLAIPLIRDGRTAKVILQSAGIEPSDLYISKVVEKSAAEKSGLQENDRVFSINGTDIDYWEDLVLKVQKYSPEQGPLKLKVFRSGKVVGVEIRPEITTQQDHAGKDKNVYALGIMTSMSMAPPQTILVKTTNPFKAVVVGFQKTVHWTKATVLSFLRLIQNRVSAKSIGGPIMIGQLASKTFQIGLSAFLKIMAIISINLFVLNLLPIPILDGGHLLFYVIEGLRGAPLSMKKLEIAQQIGLVLLMGLMVFALFNDITRLFQ